MPITRFALRLRPPSLRGSRPWGLLLLSALAAGTPPLAGQEPPPSILTLLEAGNRALAPGASVEGTLEADIHLTTDGRPVQAWSYQGGANETVTFDLVSTDFDSFLYLLGPGLVFPLSDDDSGGACHSRITTTLPFAGTYTLVVSALGIPGASAFTLSASAEPGPLTGAGGCGAGSAWDPAVLGSLDSAGRSVSTREEVTGRLTEEDIGEDGTFAQGWDLVGQVGETVAIDLISDDFDAFLLVAGPGLMGVQSDDDSGGACNSRIMLELPESGTYRLVVSAVGDAREGAFTLRTAGEPGPVAEGTCGTYDEILGTLGGPGLEVLAGLDPGDRVLPTQGVVEGRLLESDPPFPGGGGPMQAWLLRGTAGQQVTVELHSSEFDPFMALAGPGIDPMTDDDGGTGFDSRISVTLPADGEYRVVVTSVGSRTGSYRLTVSGGGD